MKNRLEIPVRTIEEINIAEIAGADSLELSIVTEKGGITPDFDFVTDLLWNISIPCYLVLRPNYDTFEVNDDEFEQILHFLEIAKLTKIKGISIGILKEGRIDRERIQDIINRKGELEIHFTHAIDSSMQYEDDLEWLIENEGIERIATSGGAETIFDGFQRLEPYKERIKKKLTLGKSINVDNIEKIIKQGYCGVVFQVRYSLLGIDGKVDFAKIQEVLKKLRLCDEMGE